jgi:hypothetical protein
VCGVKRSAAANIYVFSRSCGKTDIRKECVSVCSLLSRENEICGATDVFRFNDDLQIVMKSFIRAALIHERFLESIFVWSIRFRALGLTFYVFGEALHIHYCASLNFGTYK